MERLLKIIESIEPSDKSMYKAAKNKWDHLFKIRNSLGELEEMTSKICAMRGEIVEDVKDKAIVVLVSDNGVVDEGVTMTPRDHTTDLTKATLIGKTAIGAMTDYIGVDRYVVDMGLFEPLKGTIDMSLGRGTKNLYKEPAMTRETCINGIIRAIEFGNELYKKYDIIGVGELGMGNTTTSAAVLRGLTGLDAKLITGRGAGLTDEGFKKKIKVVRESLRINNVNVHDPIDILSKVGGFDHVGMTGLYLSAALNKKPIVMDGLISSVGALVATRLNENVKDYLIPSHLSKEPAAKYVMEELNLQPAFRLNMRLGEGVGCPIVFEVLDLAFVLLHNMYTAEDAEVDINSYVDIDGKAYNLDKE